MAAVSVFFFRVTFFYGRDIRFLKFVTGIFLKIVTGVLEMSRAEMSRADVTGIFRHSEICHGHSQNVTGIFLFFFFYDKVKFHKIIWLKEYRQYRISSHRGSSFTAKKILKM